MTAFDIATFDAIVVRGLKSEWEHDPARRLCISRAIAIASGEPQADRPSRIAPDDFHYMVDIGNALWSSPGARSAALRPLALTSLGTAGTDRTAWASRTLEGVIRRILPVVLRAAADMHTDEKHRAEMRAAADRCETEGTQDSASDACDAAGRAGDAVGGATNLTYCAARAARAAAYGFHSTPSLSFRLYVLATGVAAGHAAAGIGTDDLLHMGIEIAMAAYAAEGRTPDSWRDGGSR